MAETKEKKTVLTKDGYKKLEAELDYYISVRRNEIADQIAVARGFGDLSENAEYDEAKNEQSRIEAKIVEMENTLRNCIVIDDDDVVRRKMNIEFRTVSPNIIGTFKRTNGVLCRAFATPITAMRYHFCSAFGICIPGKKKAEQEQQCKI